MDKEKLKQAGRDFDDNIGKAADRHNFKRWQVWAGLLIGVIAAVAVNKWVL